jgi:RNA polymerase sigma factor (sigma-70 family)
VTELPPFQALLDEHRDHVFRFLVASVGREEAEDCLQETLLAALRAYPRLRSASNLRAWMLTIAHRKALDSHRARRTRPLVVESVPDGGGVRDRTSLDGEPELWQAVRELPDKQRAAVLCRFAGDLSYREIGAAMDTSEAAARRNVHEALEKLRGAWRA